MAYASFKYGLMDIDLIWRYGASYTFYALISSSIFILAVFFVRQYFLAVALLFVLFAFFAPYLHRWLTGYFKPVMLGDKYRYWKKLDNLAVSSERFYTSIDVVSGMVSGISKIMNTDCVSCFIYDKNRKEFCPMAQVGKDEFGNWLFSWVTLKGNEPLLKFLAVRQKPLLREDLTGDNPTPELLRILATMDTLSAELCLPLFVDNQLAGLLSLGKKPKGELYHREDVQKLLEIVRAAESNLSHTLFMEKRSIYSKNLAHDMKNMIYKTMSPTYSSLVQSKNETEKEAVTKALGYQINFLGDALGQFFNMNTIFDKILSNSYELKPLDIKILIKAIAQAFQAAYQSKGLEIKVDIPRLPSILGNEEDLKKIFHNLLDNAWKFTKEGHVLLRAEQKDGGVKITIQDTGSGMTEERLARIWEPSFQIDGENHEYEGTGLGLTIIRDIVEAHKGNITVQSKPGEGTTFHLTLNIA